MLAHSNKSPEIEQYDPETVAVPISKQLSDGQYQYEQILVPYTTGPVNPSDLTSVKAYLLLAIKQKHDALLGEGYQTSFGFRVDIMPNNIIDWTANLQLMTMSGSESTIICDYNNDKHAMSIQDYSAMCIEIGAYVVGILRTTKWAIRDAISAATTIDEAYGAAVWPTEPA